MNEINLSVIELFGEIAQSLEKSDEGQLFKLLDQIQPQQLFSFPCMVAALYAGGARLMCFIATLGRENTERVGFFTRVLDISLRTQRASAGEEADVLNQNLLRSEIWKAYLDDAGESNEAHLAALLVNASLDIQAKFVSADFLLSVGQVREAISLFMTIKGELGEKTPKLILGKISTCLHLCGDYAEAEALAAQSLGDLQKKLEFSGEIFPEEQLLAAWGGRAPVISIICVTYNHVRYIERAIKGFVGQKTQFPFEILIHDDASTDGTADVIRKWHGRYPTLIKPIFQEENQLSKGRRAFDLLLKKSQGRYIATCEGDDFWISPDKLEMQVSFLEKNPEYSSSTHNYYLYDESHLSIGLWYRPEKEQRIFEANELMGLIRFLWLPTLVFRKIFDVLPVERDFAAMGDSFLTSYLGNFGKAMSFESFTGSVRRLNQFSIWTPIPERQKEWKRVKTRYALVRLHERLGNKQAVRDLSMLIQAANVDLADKARLAEESSKFVDAMRAERE